MSSDFMILCEKPFLSAYHNGGLPLRRPAVFISYLYLNLTVLSPKKNSASVPGPTCEPVTGS